MAKRSIALGSLIAGALALAVSGAAVQPTEPDVVITDPGFTKEWVGHTRRMVIRPDGSAQVELFSGAFNGEKWHAEWKVSRMGIDITLKARESITGEGHPSLYRGLTWTAAMQTSSDGPVVLHSVDLGGNLEDMGDGIVWCDAELGYSWLCGA